MVVLIVRTEVNFLGGVGIVWKRLEEIFYMTENVLDLGVYIYQQALEWTFNTAIFFVLPQ